MGLMVLSDSGHSPSDSQWSDRRETDDIPIDDRDDRADASLATETNYAMHPVSLAFRDPDVERKFTIENHVRHISLTRFWLGMGAFVFCTYGILDYFIVPDILFEAWFIRFGVVAPLILLTVGMTYTRWFTYRSHAWLVPAVALPSVGILVMVAIAQPPGNYLYYGGIIVVIAYAASLWRLRYYYTVLVAVLILSAYEVVSIYVNPIPTHLLINNNAFLALTGSMAILTSYFQELQFRRNFVDREKIRFEQRRSEFLLRKSEAANRAKNDFLAVMSHELRTPLNAIIGFSEIISNQMFGRIDQEKYVDYANDIRHSGTHLLSIINDILDLSKAESGKLELEEAAIDPVESLNATMRMFRQKASEVGVQMTYRVKDDLPGLIADPRLFSQVAINLMSNALKFTPEGGEVSAELGLDENRDLALTIKDSGIGIKDVDLQRIFEPFVQVENALSRKHQGTGLGLPLVRKIMTLHGGTVKLESQPGIGTKVTVTFPKSRFTTTADGRTMLWGA